jgi:hypothetical protein
MSIPFTITDLTATVYLDGEPFVVDRTTRTFKLLVEALKQEPVDTEKVSTILAGYGAELAVMKQENKGRVEITRRAVLFNGAPVNEALTRRILDISEVGLPVDPWIAFVENLYSNPAEHARNELYLWLEKADLPLTEDGCFLAYKRVSSTFKDLHTGTFDNSPGTVVTMPGGRPAVDPIRDNVCSRGLHFCSKEYLPHFGSTYGDKVVLVKINPADVVSIPSDYDNTKGRTWRYEVVREIEDYDTREWAPIVADDGEEWYRKDPFGNLIKADPYAVEEDAVLEDKYGTYTLGIYPESVREILPNARLLYPDRVGDVVRIYTDEMGWDFDADVDDSEYDDEYDSW